MCATPAAGPELEIDLFTDDAIREPYPLYREIRARGPAVWLPAPRVWALGRFADVRTALRADDALVSSLGVALNDFLNGQSSRTTLTSDGEVHRARRGLVMKPMMPSALSTVRERIERLADERVEALLRALVARVRRIEVGEPQVLMSNMLRGHANFRAVLS